MLVVDRVSKSFSGVKVLDNVTLEAFAGEVHGLVGENGAGKSTLMAIATGALSADSGFVTVDGQKVRDDPEDAKALGIAIVRQEPALMTDLTVAENLFLGLPSSRRPRLTDLRKWAKQLLLHWSADVPVSASDRVDGLAPEQRFIIEIVKAIAGEPKVLVLDEPTEHLASADTARLFDRIRQMTARGAAVVYISHRIREVQDIADRITVLRDGLGQGTYKAKELNEDDIVRLIVGTSLEQEFPPKIRADSEQAVVLETRALSGPGYQDVSLQLRRGEILGLAGIEANGQREFMRAVAGLNRNSGEILIDGRQVSIRAPTDAMGNGIRYLPNDRHVEGLFTGLSVRENFSARSIARDALGGYVLVRNERARAREAISRFSVKTPSIESPVSSLSGGNQQKLLLASVLAGEPQLLLVDEPTQGVDVGARAEIYGILREIAGRGVGVALVSSDFQEVAGLCDRVAVFSRGQVVKTLVESPLTESAITSTVLKSTSVRARDRLVAHPLWKWAAGDVAPIVTVAAAVIVMGALAAVSNEYYLTTRNMSGMLILIATLAFAAYGQQTVLLTGGIDLSVGPLMGLVQIVGSFYLTPEATTGDWAVGWTLMLGAAIATGVVNWFLADRIQLHPMVATLATFMAVQAVSLLLRPQPAGLIDERVLSALGAQISFVPVSLIAAVGVGLIMETVLHLTRLGLEIRGFGSRPEAARVVGVVPTRIRFTAYVGCSIFAFVAAASMIQQVGIGDPRSGIGYTLTSIAAVVIGGGSLFGGRGSFVGALLGSVFITQVNTVTNFLGFNAAWQSYLLGVMVIAAVALYSKSRQLAIMT
jgi:ribose transport system ATP-binding protein